MKTRVHSDRSFEFYFRDVDTRVVVEDVEDAVVIRASRDSFSERRKQSFIRELAAEGFIADCFQWSCRGIRWVADSSAAAHKDDVAILADRFMIRLIVVSGVAWLIMLVALFLREYMW